LLLYGRAVNQMVYRSNRKRTESHQTAILDLAREESKTPNGRQGEGLWFSMTPFPRIPLSLSKGERGRSFLASVRSLSLRCVAWKSRLSSSTILVWVPQSKGGQRKGQGHGRTKKGLTPRCKGVPKGKITTEGTLLEKKKERKRPSTPCSKGGTSRGINHQGNSLWENKQWRILTLAHCFPTLDTQETH